MLWERQGAEQHCCLRKLYPQVGEQHPWDAGVVPGGCRDRKNCHDWLAISSHYSPFDHFIGINGNSATDHFWWEKSVGQNQRRYMNPILSSGRVRVVGEWERRNLLIHITWHRLFKEFSNQPSLFPNQYRLCRLH